VVQSPDKFKRLHPDDTIPMYFSNEEIVFYFPSGPIKNMKNLIKDISDQVKWPFNKSKIYPPYKSPLRLAMVKLDER
jgi:hypothetical protein